MANYAILLCAILLLYYRRYGFALVIVLGYTVALKSLLWRSIEAAILTAQGAEATLSD